MTASGMRTPRFQSVRNLTSSGFPRCAARGDSKDVTEAPMRKLLYFIAPMVLITAPPCLTASAEETFEGWNLEPGVSQAQLVMVARVASISRVTVVEGAKTDMALREYRFQSVRILKGIFQRDQLSMTAADLGCPVCEGPAAPPLKEG